MVKSKTILLCLIVFLFGALIYCNYNKKKENYADVYYNKELNSDILTRPSFNSNLDPNNMNLRFDPNVYGGFIKGNSPSVDNLASYNKMSSESFQQGGQKSREGFAPQFKAHGSLNQNVGTVDAASFVSYKDTDYEGLGVDNPSGSSTFKNAGGYGQISNDFSSYVDTPKQTKMNASSSAYKASLNNNYNPDTLKYTVPGDLLPAPDMRQQNSRDPSDPSNFMYDRTIFAPMKKRNHNEADRIRGDLDIEPVKTGWFDVATVPKIDLVKGYLGYFTDIQEFQDLQDISYQRAREQTMGQDTTDSTTALSKLTGMISQDMVAPKLSYATSPDLELPISAWGQNRAFAL